jgi:hypothetical protein
LRLASFAPFAPCPNLNPRAKVGVMGGLTEVEIFDCLAENARRAAEHAENLAKLPRKGPTYRAYRDCLRLVEGCCRQIASFRFDSTWLKLGLQMHEAHERGGIWLRGVKTAQGVRVKLAEGHLHPLFMKMAERLRALHAKADDLRTRATGTLGPILPAPLPGPHRDTKPVGFTKRSSGLLVPESTSVH